ncbi:MAG TPA: tetratricopeptide repeat protein, partial [Gaiellaceae bacterium]|nr:tetratricopeptide repeat protein [Gaiellaceae bacterium]
WMLETIREYAGERLEEAKAAESRERRHADYFGALATEAEPHLGVELLQGGREWLDRLEHELHNLRAALDWLEAAGETESCLRMAGALSDFWDGSGHVVEGLRRLERALSVDARPTAARARALGGASAMARLCGKDAQAGLWAEEALALNRALGDRRGVADSLFGLGYAAGEDGNWGRAEQLFRESLELLRDVGDEHQAVWLTRTLAWAHAEGGDLEGARELYEDGLRAARELGNPLAEAALLGSLAWLAVGEGRAQDSLPLLHQSLLIKRESGDRVQIATGLSSTARALAAVGRRMETAARLIACFESLSGEIGAGEAWVTRMNEETLPKIRAQLDDAAFNEAWEQGQNLTLDEAVALALSSLD